jgi:hypothetical protein
MSRPASQMSAAYGTGPNDPQNTDLLIIIGRKS